jgi:hypothetical protein
VATGITMTMNIFFKAVLSIFAATALQAFGQDSTPTPMPDSKPDIHQLLDEVRQGGLEEFQKKEPATPEEYREYVHLLTQLVEAETLTEDWANAADTLDKQTAEVRESIANFHPPEANPEGGLDLYDKARLKGWQAEEWLEALNKMGSTRAAQANNSFEALKDQQQKLRTIETAGAPSSPREAWLLKLQETRVQAALAENKLRTNGRCWQSDVDLQKARIQLQKLMTSSLEGRVTFPEDLLKAKLVEIQKLEGKIADSVGKVGRQLKKLPAGNLGRDEKDPSSQLITSLESQLELLEYHRIALLITGQVWQSRYDLWNTKDAQAMEQIARLLEKKARKCYRGNHS